MKKLKLKFWWCKFVFLIKKCFGIKTEESKEMLFKWDTAKHELTWSTVVKVQDLIDEFDTVELAGYETYDVPINDPTAQLGCAPTNCQTNLLTAIGQTDDRFWLDIDTEIEDLLVDLNEGDIGLRRFVEDVLKKIIQRL
jgi:hypothetical protein